VLEMPDVNIAEMLRCEGIDPVDARVLLGIALEVNRAYLAAHPEQTLSDHQRDCYLALVERRRAGEPIAYLTGEREFYGLAFKVTPAVLIPRPESELLVELALERVDPDRSGRALDLGTGSGCVAVAIARHRPRTRLVATEFASAALDVARENARRHAVDNVEFMQSDWFDALRGERFDLVVANPPYVPAGDPHLAQGDARFEPRLALVGGRDGLGSIRKIAAGARDHISPGGWLLFEHGYDQGPRCIALLRRLGYATPGDFNDFAGLPRACAGRWRG